jgi:hypothetical protein
MAMFLCYRNTMWSSSMFYLILFNIFSHPEGCLFFLIIISFTVCAKLFSLMLLNLSVFVFVSVLWGFELMNWALSRLFYRWGHNKHHRTRKRQRQNLKASVLPRVSVLNHYSIHLYTLSIGDWFQDPHLNPTNIKILGCPSCSIKWYSICI